ncbi:MAG: aminotransferase class I/II-fold pyridoxal phosphate-dependent enzyme [Thermoplasmatota archaeon]
MMFDFPTFRHVNWLLDLERPAYDLSSSNIIPEWKDYARTYVDDSLIREGNPRGGSELKGYLSESYGVDQGRIVITNGTSEANTLAFVASLRKGDHVLVEKPVYSPLIEFPRAMGCRISFIKRRPDDYRFDLRELRTKLEEGIDLLVMQNPNNPTGRAVFREDLAALASLLSEFDVPVLSDEIYRDFTLGPGTGERMEPAVPSMAGMFEKAIVTSSVTKVYGASGLVTGWLIAPRRIANHARKAKSYMVPMVCHMGNRLAYHILRDRDKVLPGAFSELREKLRLVSQWAAGRPDVHWSEPDGCAIGFLRYDHDVPSTEMAAVLYERYDTKVVPGEFFHIEKGFRIGLSRPYDEIKGGLTMIDRCLDDLS